MSKISERLQEALLYRKAKPTEIADNVGCGDEKESQRIKTTISRYLNGKRDPDSFDVLVMLAEQLNTSTDFLLGVSNSIESSSLSAEEAILLSCFRRASPDDIDTLWMLLRKYMTDNEKQYIQQLEQQLQAV